MNLTNDRRDRIIRLLLEHTFDAESLELQNARSKIGPKIYNTVFSAANRKKMKALPAGWLRQGDSIRANLAQDFETFDLPERLPFPHSTGRHDCAISLDGGHPITEEFRSWKAATEDLRKRKNEAQSAARATIYSHRTVKQLLDAWPDIEPFVKQVCNLDKGRDVPVIPVSNLNKTFKLPVKKKAA